MSILAFACTGVATALLAGSLAARSVNALLVAPPEIDTAAVGRFVSAYCARTGLPGAVVAITRGNRAIYLGGQGTSSDGSPLDADSRLPIASLS